ENGWPSELDGTLGSPNWGGSRSGGAVSQPNVQTVNSVVPVIVQVTSAASARAAAVTSINATIRMRMTVSLRVSRDSLFAPVGEGNRILQRSARAAAMPEAAAAAKATPSYPTPHRIGPPEAARRSRSARVRAGWPTS